ncbi:hypothetical protein JXI42_02095 [bacterium]|nr:hypothetical protein [bacterium]
MSAKKKDKIIDFPQQAQSPEGVKVTTAVLKYGEWKLAYNKSKKAA